jgi:RNA polymerase sigma factor (sigma-70 family)
MWGVLSRLCRRSDVAEDLYQEMWIKLAVHAHRLAEDTDIAAWLYTVARNLARSEQRAVRSGTPTSAFADDAEDAAHAGPSPYEWAAANETQARLEQALADLPAQFREVLVLVVIEGVEHDRAATILELSPEALRQRLGRARAKLAERLDELSKVPRSKMKE